PTQNSGPEVLTLGPDGAIWFTKTTSDGVGRITLSGALSEFHLQQFNRPRALISGPDGNLWITANDEQMGRLSPSGQFKRIGFTLANATTYGIASGSNDTLWFTEPLANRIGSITLSTSAIIHFPIPTVNSSPFGITLGPDRALWFTEFDGNQI